MTAVARTLADGRRIALANGDDGADGGDALDQWAAGVSHRLALQAEVVWPALQDGYADGASDDPAAPYAHLWWELGAVKTEHCADCPWLAYNSPYDPPGSGGNELAQTPGDGQTDCGAGCKCSLRYGDWTIPADADWIQYMMPPDAPMVNQPANPGLIPSTIQQQRQGYAPPRLPIGVDANGDYVYPGTPAETAYNQQRAPFPALYGSVDEPMIVPADTPGLSVSPISDAQAELSAEQKRALDGFRRAWSAWDRVRGARPAARALFGYVWDEQRRAFVRPSATAGTLVPIAGEGFRVQQGADAQFAASWAELSPAQQRALVALWRAIVAWNDAVSDAGAGVADAMAGEHSSQQLAEWRDGDVVLLYAPEQQRDAHGRWTYEGRVARIAELRGKIAEHQAAVKELSGQKSKVATGARAEARTAIAGHRAEIAEHQAAIKDEAIRLNNPYPRGPHGHWGEGGKHGEPQAASGGQHAAATGEEARLARMRATVRGIMSDMRTLDDRHRSYVRVVSHAGEEIRAENDDKKSVRFGNDLQEKLRDSYPIIWHHNEMPPSERELAVLATRGAREVHVVTPTARYVVTPGAGKTWDMARWAHEMVPALRRAAREVTATDQPEVERRAELKSAHYRGDTAAAREVIEREHRIWEKAAEYGGFTYRRITGTPGKLTEHADRGDDDDGETIRLTGGHGPGYSQNRDSRGRRVAGGEPRTETIRLYSPDQLRDARGRFADEGAQHAHFQAIAEARGRVAHLERVLSHQETREHSIRQALWHAQDAVRNVNWLDNPETAPTQHAVLVRRADRLQRAYSRARDAKLTTETRLVSARSALARAMVPRTHAPGQLGHGVFVDYGSDARAVHEALKSLFGRDLADHEVGALVGAQHGDFVQVTALRGPGGTDGGVEFEVTGRRGLWSAARTLNRGRDGELVMHNDFFRIHDQATRKGMGTAIFARQTAGLANLGVDRIETTAARSDDMNGYYTWARLGYDGHLPNSVLGFHAWLRNVAPRGTVREVMAAHEITMPSGEKVSGANLWKRIGDTWNGVFDLAPGSRSRQVLRAYLEEKGKKPMADELHLSEAMRYDDEPHAEEIEWTADDEAAADRAWARLTEQWAREDEQPQG